MLEREAETEGEETAARGVQAGPGQRPSPGTFADPPEQTTGVQVVSDEGGKEVKGSSRKSH